MDGYTLVCKEGGEQYFSITTDIAYSETGKYFYKNSVTGKIKFDNATNEKKAAAWQGRRLKTLKLSLHSIKKCGALFLNKRFYCSAL
ncbi:MAG: hypothetical protein ACI8ZM_001982 [Crocinitomix sp.]